MVLEATPQERSRRTTIVALVLVALLATLLLRFFLTWHPHAAARPTPNGGVILGWRAAHGATSYVVRFETADGREIDTIDGIETLEVVLTRDALPRHLLPGTVVRWRVIALRGPRPVGRSPAAELKLP